MRERGAGMNSSAESLGYAMRISSAVYRRKVSTKATMLLFVGGRRRRLVITMGDARCEMRDEGPVPRPWVTSSAVALSTQARHLLLSEGGKLRKRRRRLALS